MAKRCLKSKLTFAAALFSLFFSFHADCQTKLHEHNVLTHYFPVFISNIQNHLAPVLSKEQLRIMREVKMVVDTNGYDNYAINSYPETRQITIGAGLLRAITRFAVAQVIGVDTADFDRKRFDAFYTNIYPYLANGIYPEDAAELSGKQRQVLARICNTDQFSWVIEGKLMFLYLHELHHQLQNYTKQVAQLKKRYHTKSLLHDKLQELEMSADTFAVSKIISMGLDPEEYGDALTFLSLIKERIFPTVQDVVFRQINYDKYCAYRLGCSSTSVDAACGRFNKRIQETSKLYRFYHSLFAEKHMNVIVSQAVQHKDINSLYNLGDFYLKGTTRQVANADSALFFYANGAKLKRAGSQLYGATSADQFDSIKEYCCLIAGKICELQKKDPKQALIYYQQAGAIATMFSKNYYDSLIKSIKKE